MMPTGAIESGNVAVGLSFFCANKNILQAKANVVVVVL